MANYKVVKSIKRKGYPTSAKNYEEAHSEADNAEKHKYPKAYKDMKSVDKKLKSSQLSGTHSKTGNIKIAKSVPVRDRGDVALHEKTEFEAQKRLKSKRK